MGGYQSTDVSKPNISKIGANIPNVGENKSAHTVVIPVDGSNHSEVAFQWYLKNCHKPGNIVRIIHCQELTPSSPIMAEHTFRTQSWLDMMEQAREKGTSLVNKYEKKLSDNCVEGSVHFEVGRPGEAVVGAAEKFQAQHIVMGSRGFGVIRRTILGSVSEYVIHHCEIPVTVVPKETQKWFF